MNEDETPRLLAWSSLERSQDGVFLTPARHRPRDNMTKQAPIIEKRLVEYILFRTQCLDKGAGFQFCELQVF